MSSTARSPSFRLGRFLARRLLGHAGHEFGQLLGGGVGLFLETFLIVQVDRDVEGGGHVAVAEFLPAFAGLAPGILGHLAEHAFLFDGFGVVDQPHRGIRVKDQRAGALDRDAQFVDHVLGRLIPTAADKPVVALAQGDVFHVLVADVLVEEIVVLLEELAVLDVLVGAADLLRDVPAHVVQQAGFVHVDLGAGDDEVDALDHPVVAVAVVVELDGNVVGQVPALEPPDGDEVGLEADDLFQGGGKGGPVFGFLVFVGLHPHDVGRDSAHAQRGQLDRFAGRIDFSQVGLTELVLFAQLGELAAGRAFAPFLVPSGRLAQIGQWQQQKQDRRGISHFVPNGAALIHLATSRVFRKK